MSDELGCFTYECGSRDALDLYGIVGDKTVSALEKLDRGLALTYSRITEEKNTLAVNLDENAVASNSRTKLKVKKRDKRGHKLGGALACAKKRNLILGREGNRLGLNLNRARNYNSCRCGAEEILKTSLALLLGKLGNEEVLYLTYYLNTLLLIVVVEADHLKSRTVNTGAIKEYVLGQIGQVYSLKIKGFYYLFERNCIKFIHSFMTFRFFC